MSSLSSIINLYRNISVTSKFIRSPIFYNAFFSPFRSQSTVQDKLMQFFDEKKNWGEKEIQVGRSWKKDELRIKSNSDLHKLWFVLLKERNMLLTMEQECKRYFQLFPNPERIDKIEESMENLETVVRERNKSYHLLETGTTGERPAQQLHNQFNLEVKHEMEEYTIPKSMNKRWTAKYGPFTYGFSVSRFQKFYKEKLYIQKRREAAKTKRHVELLIKMFPDMDFEKLKAEYPDVNVEKLRFSKRARGHYIPKEFL